MSWAETELAGANLGDKRRNKRLVKIVSDLAAKPHESVPQASRDSNLKHTNILLKISIFNSFSSYFILISSQNILIFLNQRKNRMLDECKVAILIWLARKPSTPRGLGLSSPKTNLVGCQSLLALNSANSACSEGINQPIGGLNCLIWARDILGGFCIWQKGSWVEATTSSSNPWNKLDVVFMMFIWDG